MSVLSGELEVFDGATQHANEEGHGEADERGHGEVVAQVGWLVGAEVERMRGATRATFVDPGAAILDVEDRGEAAVEQPVVQRDAVGGRSGCNAGQFGGEQRWRGRVVGDDSEAARLLRVGLRRLVGLEPATLEQRDDVGGEPRRIRASFPAEVRQTDTLEEVGAIAAGDQELGEASGMSSMVVLKGQVPEIGQGVERGEHEHVGFVVVLGQG